MAALLSTLIQIKLLIFLMIFFSAVMLFSYLPFQNKNNKKAQLFKLFYPFLVVYVEKCLKYVVALYYGYHGNFHWTCTKDTCHQFNTVHASLCGSKTKLLLLLTSNNILQRYCQETDNFSSEHSS